MKQRPFQVVGERREAMIKLIEELEKEGKVEKGVSAWCSPAFPVAKKKPGEYRLVIDYRKLNEATMVDGQPLPRIEEILIRQGKYKIWSVLDMKDGFHQVPMAQESKHFTCMSTPLGVYQWVVMQMGLTNAPAIFQRMIEWVLREHLNVDPYIDDVIIGSSGNTTKELLDNHQEDIRKVLRTLAQQDILVSQKKAQLFMEEVEFCGHILREGSRSPAPGKLMAVQKWELPKTVTQLRGFLGLTNYYSSYVQDYARMAGPLS